MRELTVSKLPRVKEPASDGAWMALSPSDSRAQDLSMRPPVFKFSSPAFTCFFVVVVLPLRPFSKTWFLINFCVKSEHLSLAFKTLHPPAPASQPHLCVSAIWLVNISKLTFDSFLFTSVSLIVLRPPAVRIIPFQGRSALHHFLCSGHPSSLASCGLSCCRSGTHDGINWDRSMGPHFPVRLYSWLKAWPLL